MASLLKETVKKAKALPRPELAEPNKPSSQLFAPSSIANTLRQFESVRGRSLAPGIVEEAVGGAIQAQIAPAIAREEARAENERMREFQRQESETAREEEKRKARAAGGASIGTAIGTAVGGPIGGAIGGVLGGSTIICTELNRQGYLSRKDLIYTHMYRKKYLSDEEYQGYLIWATPVVELMKKSINFTRLVKFMFMPAVKESISKVSGRKGSIRGKILLPLVRIFSKIAYRRQKWQIWVEA